MNHEQVKAMLRDPKAMMQFQLNGSLKSPHLYRPARTPLLDLLESLPLMLRGRICGVTLSPALGYNISHQFRSAEHLYRYIGGGRRGGSPETGEYRAVSGFRKQLTLDMLLDASACPPPDSVIRCFIPLYRRTS